MAYDTVTIKLDTLEKYSLLVAFCRENLISIESIEQDKPEFSNREKRAPRSPFKSFCGPENLNRQGLLAEEDVYRVLMRYAKSRNLLMPKGRIQLNQALKDAFAVDVGESDIQSLIQKAF